MGLNLMQIYLFSALDKTIDKSLQSGNIQTNNVFRLVSPKLSNQVIQRIKEIS